MVVASKPRSMNIPAAISINRASRLIASSWDGRPPVPRRTFFGGASLICDSERGARAVAGISTSNIVQPSSPLASRHKEEHNRTIPSRSVESTALWTITRLIGMLSTRRSAMRDGALDQRRDRRGSSSERLTRSGAVAPRPCPCRRHLASTGRRGAASCCSAAKCHPAFLGFFGRAAASQDRQEEAAPRGSASGRLRGRRPLRLELVDRRPFPGNDRQRLPSSRQSDGLAPDFGLRHDRRGRRQPGGAGGRYHCHDRRPGRSHRRGGRQGRTRQGPGAARRLQGRGHSAGRDRRLGQGRHHQCRGRPRLRDPGRQTLRGPADLRGRHLAARPADRRRPAAACRQPSTRIAPHSTSRKSR